jgi:hypothetical protein
MMNLDEAQRKKVADWIGEGLKLSEIQERITNELGIQMTYMEVRLLVDDLKLLPKDIEPRKTADLALPRTGGAAGKPGDASTQGVSPAAGGTARPGGISVTVSEIARPGSLVSGNVTFSDGQQAEWYLDQMGRLGLLPAKQGYRPSAEDLQDFQAELQSELAKMGL